MSGNFTVLREDQLPKLQGDLKTLAGHLADDAEWLLALAADTENEVQVAWASEHPKELQALQDLLGLLERQPTDIVRYIGCLAELSELTRILESSIPENAFALLSDEPGSEG